MNFRIPYLSAVLLTVSAWAAVAAEKPNILLITVDDMSCDSVGVYGCELANTTPNMDRLAAEGMRFHFAHVQVGNCYPSRNVMWSGRYPHNNGAEGFYQVKPIEYPVMCDLMKGAGYYTAIRGKISHSTPYQPYAWDADLTKLPDGGQAHMKDVESYYTSTKTGIDNAKAAGKPFCLNVNISDPHKPFWKPGDKHPASLEFTADEVPVPKFLHDSPQIRQELALYYTSVRRADDAVGAILRALEESGQSEKTMVMFLSDHGMPLPFAKTQLYHHSTRTPLIVKWPGVTKAGYLDDDHMVSAVDFTPTLCDIAGIEHPDGFDGRSFLPVIKGEEQDDRDSVFKVYNENAGGNRHPIRGVQTKQYLYLFNPWSDGENVFKTATQGTATWKWMKTNAAKDPVVAARVDLLEHRVVEELYDVKNDPDCLKNLIDNPTHSEALADLRGKLKIYMAHSNDHALEVFQNREDESARVAYMTRVQEETDARRAAKRKNNKNKGKSQPKKSGKKKAKEEKKAAAGADAN